MMLERGGFPQQGLVPQLFQNHEVCYRPKHYTKAVSGRNSEEMAERTSSNGWTTGITLAANGWAPEEEKVMLPLYPVGNVSQHYRNIPQPIKNDIVLLQMEIEKHFNSPSQRLQFRNVLGETYQKPLESVADVYEDVCRLVQRG